MIRLVIGSIAAAVLTVVAAQADSKNSKSGGRPGNAHVAISLGDGGSIESKSGQGIKSVKVKTGRKISRPGTNMSPWTVTHGRNSGR